MVATAEAPQKMVGQAIKRREDPRLITGAGNYLDDVKLPGLTYAALVRSPHAHAKVERIDTARAKGMPGVLGVFTGDDFMDLNPLPAAWQAAGVKNNAVTPRVLAVNEVHQVGDPVAVVVAESLSQATDATDAV
ncbi:MAG: xanthine dehydrogenase family protein molybdopterin-binding subunit, partial [Thermoanaerobaculia bacterium]